MNLTLCKNPNNHYKVLQFNKPYCMRLIFSENHQFLKSISESLLKNEFQKISSLLKWNNFLPLLHFFQSSKPYFGADVHVYQKITFPIRSNLSIQKIHYYVSRQKNNEILATTHEDVYAYTKPPPSCERWVIFRRLCDEMIPSSSMAKGRYRGISRYNVENVWTLQGRWGVEKI